MQKIDPHKIEKAGENLIDFLMGLLHEPRFWILIIVVVLGATLIRHGWPWRKKT